jgi:hypothetical protein
VATYSTVMGLKLNDPSDAFELSDFIANWETLDASPGTYICTSNTRPNWGPGQAGRMIMMTDLKQVSWWNGSTWNDLRDAAPTFSWGAYFGKWINPGSSPVTSLCTFTVGRPCALAIFLSATYEYVNNGNQDAYQDIVFDGVKQMWGGYREQVRFAGNNLDSGNYAGLNACSLAMIPSIQPGQHNIGLEVEVGNSYRTPVYLVGAKTIAFVSLFNYSNNTL